MRLVIAYGPTYMVRPPLDLRQQRHLLVMVWACHFPGFMRAILAENSKLDHFLASARTLICFSRDSMLNRLNTCQMIIILIIALEFDALTRVLWSRVYMNRP